MSFVGPPAGYGYPSGGFSQTSAYGTNAYGSQAGFNGSSSYVPPGYGYSTAASYGSYQQYGSGFGSASTGQSAPTGSFVAPFGNPPSSTLTGSMSGFNQQQMPPLSTSMSFAPGYGGTGGFYGQQQPQQGQQSQQQSQSQAGLSSSQYSNSTSNTGFSASSSGFNGERTSTGNAANQTSNGNSNGNGNGLGTSQSASTTTTGATAAGDSSSTAVPATTSTRPLRYYKSKASRRKKGCC